MCGIAGFCGKYEAKSRIIGTLKKLEHRGYDSCGVGFTNNSSLQIIKSVGNVSSLEKKLKGQKISSFTGIGHTRWATHGKVSIENAHPHLDCSKRIAVVHNGIIENYKNIKEKLRSLHKFSSFTDTEVIPHLIENFMLEGADFENAFFHALKELKGSFAIVAIFKGENRIFFAQKNSSLIVYKSNDGVYLVSDPAGLPDGATEIIPVKDDEWGIISSENIKIFDFSGKEKKFESTTYSSALVHKPNKHFLLKEIMEQPRTVLSALRSTISFFDNCEKNFFENIEKIFLVGCGSSYHAGLIGKYYFETIARIDSKVEYASEVIPDPHSSRKNTLVIALSQSGETRDTITAVRNLKDTKMLAITNAPHSLLARLVTGHIQMDAGLEVSVAATKSFTSQIICLYIISIKMAEVKGIVSREKASELIINVLRISSHIEEIFTLIPAIQDIAISLKNSNSVFILGRGINYPVALEASLKLKEVSGIYAESYPAAEMKHGPIALIKEKTPVFFIAPVDDTYEKILNNIEEIKSRGAKVVVLTTKNNDINNTCEQTLHIPSGGNLSPVCSIIPFQLLSYFLAIEKGMPVDRPRNLAKTVTVE